MSESTLFKHILSPNLVQVMGRNVHHSWPDFDRSAFEQNVIARLDELELKQRSQWISAQLREHLPESYPDAIQILIKSLENELTEADKLGKYKEFYYMPFADFIGEYGREHFEESMRANYEITQCFTAEFSVRPFIEGYPEKCMAMLHEWAEDENYHVRRLVSEGTRPRLPWSSRLSAFQKDPSPVLELLEKLKADPELYVRRSVANNLNDIAKDNPDVVMETLTRWSKSKDKGTQWIIKHASRTLIKDGHTDALLLLGFDPKAPLAISDFESSKMVDFGTALDFSFTLENTGKAKADFVIDFVIYFKKANGKLAPKVFKLANKTLQAGEKVSFKKSHPIKPITTRVYYPGEQRLVLQVNGIEREAKAFELKM